MIKFAIKIGLATAAVYYINDEGIWKNSKESEKTYHKLKHTISPYVEQATSHLPFEIPQLPERNILSSIVKETWNKGVSVSFKFIADLPNTTSKWTAKGIEAAKQNEGIRQFIDSFSTEK